MCSGLDAPAWSAPKRGLLCSGIWGGNRNIDQDLRAGGLAASLYSSSCDGGKGGDIWYVGVCAGNVLTRVAIADVVGHGRSVSKVSQYLYESLESHMCDPDSSSILSSMNRHIHPLGLKAITTAAVVAYDAAKHEFRISSAGHPQALFKPASDRTWSVIASGGQADENDRALPLGIALHTTYSQRTIAATSGDRLFIYTDGVTEAPNASRDLFESKRLMELLDGNADGPPCQIKSALLRALHGHTGNGLTHDDVTFITIEVM